MLETIHYYFMELPKRSDIPMAESAKNSNLIEQSNIHSNEELKSAKKTNVDMVLVQEIPLVKPIDFISPKYARFYNRELKKYVCECGAEQSTASNFRKHMSNKFRKHKDGDKQQKMHDRLVKELDGNDAKIASKRPKPEEEKEETKHYERGTTICDICAGEYASNHYKEHMAVCYKGPVTELQRALSLPVDFMEDSELRRMILILRNKLKETCDKLEQKNEAEGAVECSECLMKDKLIESLKEELSLANCINNSEKEVTLYSLYSLQDDLSKEDTLKKYAEKPISEQARDKGCDFWVAKAVEKSLLAKEFKKTIDLQADVNATLRKKLVGEAEFSTIKGTSWLNDTAINAFAKKTGMFAYDGTIVTNTYIFEYMEASYKNASEDEKLKIIAKKHKMLDQFTKKIIIPVNYPRGGHWCVLCIDKKENEIRYWDSLENNPNCAYIESVALHTAKKVLGMSKATCYSMKCQKQHNSYDCGVYACYNIYIEALEFALPFYELPGKSSSKALRDTLLVYLMNPKGRITLGECFYNRDFEIINAKFERENFAKMIKEAKVQEIS